MPGGGTDGVLPSSGSGGLVAWGPGRDCSAPRSGGRGKGTRLCDAGNGERPLGEQVSQAGVAVRPPGFQIPGLTERSWLNDGLAGWRAASGPCTPVVPELRRSDGCATFPVVSLGGRGLRGPAVERSLAPWDDGRGKDDEGGGDAVVLGPGWCQWAVGKWLAWGVRRKLSGARLQPKCSVSSPLMARKTARVSG